MKDKASFNVMVDEVVPEPLPLQSAQPSSRSFLPWDRGERPQVQLRKTSTFPLMGLLALAGSALTVVLSFVILRCIDGHEVFKSKYVKPAAWLSVILSANSIALHIAMTEGVNVAWWYRATRDRTTAAQLHDTWQMGTSLFSALLAGRNFNYIALATIFVSTVPLNGLLLQNAISPVAIIRTNNGTLGIPMLQEFPLGFSASLNKKDNSIGILGYQFGTAVTAWMNLNGASSPGTVPLSPTRWSTNCNGTCTSTVPGVGFKQTCVSSTIPYQLDPALQPNHANTVEARVLDTSIKWNSSHPNEMKVDLLWKNYSNDQCNGTYAVRNCTLEAATVEYPILIDSSLYGYPGISLNPNTTYLDDRIISTIPPLPNDGVSNTTFGAIASVLGTAFDSTLDISYANGSWSQSQTGSLATALYPIAVDDANNEPLLCALWFANVEYDAASNQDLSVDVFSSLRSLMFLSSVYGSYSSDAVTTHLSLGPDLLQTPEGQQSIAINIYKIYYRYWAASLAITLTIILIILPTFYGFWHLTRRTTLSPFETARAFNAPIIGEADDQTPTPVLLKEVGNKNVHTDLVQPTAPGDMERGMGNGRSAGDT